jgi:hypothetical protein
MAGMEVAAGGQGSMFDPEDFLKAKLEKIQEKLLKGLDKFDMQNESSESDRAFLKESNLKEDSDSARSEEGVIQSQLDKKISMFDRDGTF